jgi:acyl-coenzyme A thioesterase PaaI-like protein
MLDSDSARAMLAALPFNVHCGIEVLEVAPGRGTTRLPDRPELQNHIGTQHAGALFTLAEAASGAAVLGSFGDLLGELTPLARVAEIAYLKIAKGPITARATLVEGRDDVVAAFRAAGKADCNVKVELANEAGVKVTEVTVRWHLKKNG